MIPLIKIANMFTWYRRKAKYSNQEMCEMYSKIINADTTESERQILMDKLIEQVYDSGYHRGDDSSDGSYNKSWENVR